MEEEFLSDKASGCLLGLAIGEAMGLPADGMTPYEVLSKFGRIEGFFAGSSGVLGAYGPETTCVGTVASSIIEAKAIPEMKALVEKACHGTGGSDLVVLSFMVPVSLSLRMTGAKDEDLAKACKAVSSEMGLSKMDSLAAYAFSLMLAETMVNSASLTTPYELYESEASLLSKIASFCRRAESTIGTGLGESLCERLSFARKRLLGKFWDTPKFFGVLGQKATATDAVARAAYAFLRTPDDFSAACDAASLGGTASLNAALVGCLVGAYGGMARIPKHLSDNVKNGTKIEALARRLVKTCLKK